MSRSFELADRVVVAAVRLTKTLRALRRSADLTEPEISALAVIVHAERIAARDLAAIEGVTPATTSRLIAAMEEKGLVRRARDRTDTRLQWISATALGARRIADGHAARLAPLVAVIETLPRAKREILEQAARILDEAVAAIDVD
jgi:DNA-binding MarR family transcriptional regulator